jgi:hypothetical protein
MAGEKLVESLNQLLDLLVKLSEYVDHSKSGGAQSQETRDLMYYRSAYTAQEYDFFLRTAIYPFLRENLSSIVHGPMFDVWLTNPSLTLKLLGSRDRGSRSITIPLGSMYNYAANMRNNAIQSLNCGLISPEIRERYRTARELSAALALKLYLWRALAHAASDLAAMGHDVLKPGIGDEIIASTRGLEVELGISSASGEFNIADVLGKIVKGEGQFGGIMNFIGPTLEQHGLDLEGVKKALADASSAPPDEMMTVLLTGVLASFDDEEKGMKLKRAIEIMRGQSRDQKEFMAHLQRLQAMAAQGRGREGIMSIVNEFNSPELSGIVVELLANYPDEELTNSAGTISGMISMLSGDISGAGVGEFVGNLIGSFTGSTNNSGQSSNNSNRNKKKGKGRFAIGN